MKGKSSALGYAALNYPFDVVKEMVEKCNFLITKRVINDAVKSLNFEVVSFLLNYTEKQKNSLDFLDYISSQKNKKKSKKKSKKKKTKKTQKSKGEKRFDKLTIKQLCIFVKNSPVTLEYLQLLERFVSITKNKPYGPIFREFILNLTSFRNDEIVVTNYLNFFFKVLKIDPNSVDDYNIPFVFYLRDMDQSASLFLIDLMEKLNFPFNFNSDQLFTSLIDTIPDNIISYCWSSDLFLLSKKILQLYEEKNSEKKKIEFLIKSVKIMIDKSKSVTDNNFDHIVEQSLPISFEDLMKIKTKNKRTLIFSVAQRGNPQFFERVCKMKSNLFFFF